LIKTVKPRRCVSQLQPTAKAAIDNEREVVLDQLAADAQDQDMGYGSK